MAMFARFHPIVRSALRILLLLVAVFIIPFTCQLARQPEVYARARANNAKHQMKEWGKKLTELKAGSDTFPAAQRVNSAGIRDEQGLAVVATYGTLPSTEPLVDPFMKRANMPILYQTDGKRWVMLSAGPDRKYSTPASLLLSGEATNADLLNHCYDPTNGTFSAGDIWRVGPEAAP